MQKCHGPFARGLQNCTLMVVAREKGSCVSRSTATYGNSEIGIFFAGDVRYDRDSDLGNLRSVCVAEWFQAAQLLC